jgi:hypothetical protein
MRRLFLAAIGVLAVAGIASAQQPQYRAPVQYPTVAPSAAAATPIVPASGASIIRGDGGCSNCGSTAGRGFTMSHVGGGNCQTGAPCQSGCGSVKGDLAFHFGSCRNFFSPCGPTFGHGFACNGSLFGGKCPTQPFAQPWGQGWTCPRAYDSYANH